MCSLIKNSQNIRRSNDRVTVRRESDFLRIYFFLGIDLFLDCLDCQ
jgi:hypothetical protein